MKQIFHPHDKWECHKEGFFKGFDNSKLQLVVDMFENSQETKKYMQMVIDNWTNSCEHNLTNPTINKIAWLGQSAACLFCGASSETTKKAWHYVSEPKRNEANIIAKNIIETYLNESL
jgi:hypothetical protein